MERGSEADRCNAQRLPVRLDKDGAVAFGPRGISGTFETTASVGSIVARLKKGTCNTNTPHFRGVLIANGPRPVSYK